MLTLNKVEAYVVDFLQKFIEGVEKDQMIYECIQDLCAMKNLEFEKYYALWKAIYTQTKFTKKKAYVYLEVCILSDLNYNEIIEDCNITIKKI